MKATADEISGMLAIMAGRATVDVYVDDLKRRMTPELYEQFRASVDGMKEPMNALLDTFPPDKQHGLMVQAKHAYICVRSAKPATPDKDYVCIEGNDFQALVGAAVEKCMMCLDWKCGSCPLGKAFDRTLSIDRDGQSWGAIRLDPDWGDIGVNTGNKQ